MALTTSELQNQRLAYPEAAWIAACGGSFPSHNQWLHKFLAKVDLVPSKELKSKVSESNYTTTTSTIMKSTATVGSGRTTEGLLIHEQVSLDWVKWAMSMKIWNLLYTKEKINTGKGGEELITNEVKSVLNVSVSEGIFTTYSIVEVKVDSINNNISVKFTANLEHTILAVEVSGSLYQ